MPEAKMGKYGHLHNLIYWRGPSIYSNFTLKYRENIKKYIYTLEVIANIENFTFSLCKMSKNPLRLENILEARNSQFFKFHDDRLSLQKFIDDRLSLQKFIDDKFFFNKKINYKCNKTCL